MAALFTATYPAMVERLVLFAHDGALHAGAATTRIGPRSSSISGRRPRPGASRCPAPLFAPGRATGRGLVRGDGALPAPERVAERDPAADHRQRPDRRARHPAADPPPDADPAAARRPRRDAAPTGATWPTTCPMRCTWNCRATTTSRRKAMPTAIVDAIGRFAVADWVREPEHHAERWLATVLFTDIVGSTELAARLGDRAWRDLLQQFHRHRPRATRGSSRARDRHRRRRLLRHLRRAGARDSLRHRASRANSRPSASRFAPACTPARSRPPATRSAAWRCTSARA